MNEGNDSVSRVRKCLEAAKQPAPQWLCAMLADAVATANLPAVMKKYEARLCVAVPK